MEISPWKRLLFALILSLELHFLVFFGLFEAAGGSAGPVKFPGLLLVELIRLGSKGVEARITETKTPFPSRLPETLKKPPVPAALDLSPAKENPDMRPENKVSSEETNPGTRGRKIGDITGKAPEPSGQAPELSDGEEPPAVSSSPKEQTAPRVIPPRCVQCPPPEYPRAALQRGLEGTVTLKVEVLPQGRVGDVFVLESSGFPLLDEAAIAAVKSWRFAPAREDGRPVHSLLTVTVPFLLP